MNGEDSLERYLAFMEANDIDDDRIYAHLASLDKVKLAKWVHRLEVVENLPAPRRDRKVFEGRRDQLKGKIYEQVVGVIVDGVKCFERWQNVSSTTNELDALVILGPSAQFVPALRHWGTHLICECKYHESYVKTDWVTKLNTVLQTHRATVGLLFSKKGVARSGNGARVTQTLQILAARSPATFLLPFDRVDLDRWANDHNFLKVICTRFVEVSAGVRKLALASP